MQTPVCHATIYPILLCAHAAILKVVRWTTTCAWPQGGCCRIRYGPKTSRNSAGGGQPPQRSPDRGRRRARVRCAGDRPADDQKVGTGGERLFRRRDSRLKRRSEEHTSELQSHLNLVCRLLLEKKKSQIPYDSTDAEW